MVAYIGDGTTQSYTYPFGYLNKDDIIVFLGGVPTTNFTWVTDSVIHIQTIPANGLTIIIKRVTLKDSPPVDFNDGSVLLEEDLDLLVLYNFYLAEELDDRVESAMHIDSNFMFDARGLRIVNLGDPVNPQDAVTKIWAETAGSSILAQAAASATQSGTFASVAMTQAAIATVAASQTNQARADTVLLRDETDALRGECAGYAQDAHFDANAANDSAVAAAASYAAVAGVVIDVAAAQQAALDAEASAVEADGFRGECAGYAQDAGYDATQAALSATAADGFRGAAAGYAQDANYDAVQADLSASAALLSQTAASSSETFAAISSQQAQTSATASAQSATDAFNYAYQTNQDVVETNANVILSEDSATLSEVWATSLVEVSGGYYGSRKYAQDASADAVLADSAAYDAALAKIATDVNAYNANISAASAEEWATSPVAVTTGLYSSRKYAQDAGQLSSEAEGFANDSEGFASASDTSALSASNSASQALGSSDSANASALEAQDWATALTQVGSGYYGARKYAIDAEQSYQDILNINISGGYNFPAISALDTGKGIAVNVLGDGYDLVDLSSGGGSVGLKANRNLFINGGFQVNQYNLLPYTGTTSFQYIADMIGVRNDAGASISYNIQDTTLPNGRTSKSFKVSATAAIANSSEALIYCKVDTETMKAYGRADDGSVSYTLSFWAKSNKIGDHAVSIRCGEKAYIFPMTFNINNTGNWVKITKTIVFTGTAIDKLFTAISSTVLFALSNDILTASTDAWETSTAYGAPATVNPLDVINGYLEIAEVQLEQGDATEFERVTHDDNLRACQYYYEGKDSEYLSFTNHVKIGFGYFNSVMYNSVKRVTPVISLEITYNSGVDIPYINSISKKHIDIVALATSDNTRGMYRYYFSADSNL